MIYCKMHLVENYWKPLYVCYCCLKEGDSVVQGEGEMERMDWLEVTAGFDHHCCIGYDSTNNPTIQSNH